MPIAYHTRWCWNCRQQEGRWVSITRIYWNTHYGRVMKYVCLLQQRWERQLLFLCKEGLCGMRGIASCGQGPFKANKLREVWPDVCRPWINKLRRWPCALQKAAIIQPPPKRKQPQPCALFLLISLAKSLCFRLWTIQPLISATHSQKLVQQII